VGVDQRDRGIPVEYAGLRATIPEHDRERVLAGGGSHLRTYVDSELGRSARRRRRGVEMSLRGSDLGSATTHDA
jgi:hypothetical protein